MKNLEVLERIVLQTEQICYLLKDEGYDPSTEIQVDPIHISIDVTDRLYVNNYATTIEVFQASNDEDFRLIRIFDKTKATPRQVIETILALLNK